MTVDPYRPLESTTGQDRATPFSKVDDAAALRRAYVRHESNIKSIGQLCYLVAFFGGLGTLEFFLFAKGILESPPELNEIAPPELIQGLFWGMTLCFAILSLGHMALGFGLNRLQSWARWTVVVLTVISLASGSLLSLISCLTRPVAGLISLTAGGVINGLILYPLVSKGAGVVFSKTYRDAILKTPEIKSRMHWLLKSLIGLILVSVLGFVAYLMAIYFRIID
jgi:hypothetical protein